MNDVTVQTFNHTIQATSNGITIQAKHIPNNSVSLDKEEAKRLLEVLLIWQDGLETISPNDLGA